MWAKISSFIIRKRITLLVILAIATAFMGYNALNVQLSHEFAQIIPKSDKDYKTYEKFKETFGEDGNLFVIGFKSDNIFRLDIFNGIFELAENISHIEGVQEAISITNLAILSKDNTKRKFNINPLLNEKAKTQEEVDNLKNVISNLPFYKNLFYNEETNSILIAIRFRDDIIYSKSRLQVSDDVIDLCDAFGKQFNIQVHYSGLPYIRTILTTRVGNEMELFLFLAIAMTSLILLFLFRSVYAVIFPLIVICIIIIWTLGTISLLDYRITLLTGLIPPIIVVICVPNFIYFFNKYHIEYRKHSNKMRAITRMVQKIGIITLLTNLSTAIGFGVFAMTSSPALKELGIIASINITATFFVSLILIPVVFSLMPNPSVKQTNYLNSKGINSLIKILTKLVYYHRKKVYIAFIILVIVSVYGMTKLKAVGYMLDDIPRHDQVYTDLLFFENNFKGVMPFEIKIDAGKENGLRNFELIRNISQLQDSLLAIPEFSRSISIADFIKYTRQAFYDNDIHRYELPSQREQSFIRPFVQNMDNGVEAISFNVVDSTNRYARISAQVADVGSVNLRELIHKLENTVNLIFTDENVKVEFTGTSLVFLKGNQHLIFNLIQSMFLAFLLIAIIMGILFKRMRMVLLSLIPNFIPLIVTAGIMGYLGIPLKPSTILVFSIAFGISIDDTLHFLGKYRQELEYHNWNIPDTVTFALKETGTSMTYTSLVLFFGFAIFYFSNFGGTQALGMLVSITLLIAMSTNLLLLPSLIMSFDKRVEKS